MACGFGVMDVSCWVCEASANLEESRLIIG